MLNLILGMLIFVIGFFMGFTSREDILNAKEMRNAEAICAPNQGINQIRIQNKTILICNNGVKYEGTLK